MLLDYLIKTCSDRYYLQCNYNEKCRNCTYEDSCPGNCQTCLQYIHYPQNAPKIRKYDCIHMADCYYCKYVYKYASEIVYGLKQFADIRDKKKLKVMSIGCGPCTELVAIDYLKNKGTLNYEKLKFRGADPLENVWGNIWKDTIEYFGKGIRFFPYDILQIESFICEKCWYPDVLIFQYVFSDMFKNAGEKSILTFLDRLTDYINGCDNKTIYILCNDINLSTSYDGGREFFDELASRINDPKIVKKMHFYNSNRPKHFEYGDEYGSNALVFDKIPNYIREMYNPFESCASAQMLIKKRKKLMT